MSELKVGGSQEFQVGDKTLTVEPIPYGQVKMILRKVMDITKTAASGDTKFIPDIIDTYLPDIFPLLFKKGHYPFINVEWIENNLTVPNLRAIVEASVIVNGLEDFFGKAFGGTLKKDLPQESKTPATPLEKPGSITSSDSPTDGAPKT